MAISVYRRCLEVFVSTSMSARPATILSAARGAARDLHVAGSPSGPEESSAARAERVAAVAAKHAAVVDHDCRVPAEAIAAAHDDAGCASGAGARLGLESPRRPWTARVPSCARLRTGRMRPCRRAPPI